MIHVVGELTHDHEIVRNATYESLWDDLDMSDIQNAIIVIGESGGGGGGRCKRGNGPPANVYLPYCMYMCISTKKYSI